MLMLNKIQSFALNLKQLKTKASLLFYVWVVVNNYNVQNKPKNKIQINLNFQLLIIIII